MASDIFSEGSSRLNEIATEKPVLPSVEDDNQEEKEGYQYLQRLMTVTWQHSGIIVIDLNGRIIYANTFAQKLLGLNSGIFGTLITNFIPNTNLLATLKRQTPLVGKITVYQGTTVVSNCIPLINRGRVSGALEVFFELTRLENITGKLDDLQEQVTLMSSALDELSEGILLADRSGCIIKINRKLAQLIGVNNDIYQGQNWIYFLKKSGFKIVTDQENITDRQQGFLKRREIVYPLEIIRLTGKTPGWLFILRNEKKDHDTTKPVNIHQINYVQKNHVFSMAGQLIYRSKIMTEIYELISRVAPVDSNVLIQGESGVGKEVVARQIHLLSKRSDQPFVKVDCGAIPENLLESELFGYVSGAFTGANRDGREGLIESAHGGTLFLDEIGNLPLHLQVKLLSVIQDRQVTRIGSNQSIKVDFRLIAATNSNLAEQVRLGNFRKDLYYRLNVVPIYIPALRERKEDIIPLVEYFCSRFNGQYGLQKRFNQAALNLLIDQPWPGNVRELENTIERLLVLCQSNEITPTDLKDFLDRNEDLPCSEIKSDLKQVISETEKNLLKKVAAKCRTTREMAELLGVNQSTIVKKLKKYNLKLKG